MENPRFKPEPVSAEEYSIAQAKGGLWATTGSGPSEIMRRLKRDKEAKAFKSLMEEGTLEDKVNWLLRRYIENR